MSTTLLLSFKKTCFSSVAFIILWNYISQKCFADFVFQKRASKSHSSRLSNCQSLCSYVWTISDVWCIIWHLHMIYHLFKRVQLLQVKALGKGLEQALISRQNSFTVDCNLAGNNVLYVGVYGPEIPCDEVRCLI